MGSGASKHQQADKRILLYVTSSHDYGLHSAHFIGYFGSDHTDDIDTSKCTAGTLFFLARSLVSWQFVKQQVVALSSYEAEYIMTTSASTQALWLARLLDDQLGREAKAMELRVDSMAVLALAKNPIFHERSKHIRVKYHFIWNSVEEGSIKTSHIPTQDHNSPTVSFRNSALASA